MASEAVGMDVGPTDVVFYTSLELILVSRSGLDSRWLKSMGRDVLVALMLCGSCFLWTFSRTFFKCLGAEV